MDTLVVQARRQLDAAAAIISVAVTGAGLLLQQLLDEEKVCLEEEDKPVSYTHLTLPTILLV